jgi:hypothetical protein
MTFRDLVKYTSRLTADQLDSDIIVEADNNFYRVYDLRIASGEGDYLYKDEPFLATHEQLEEKDFDEEEEKE